MAKVIVYTADWCHWCHKAMEFFNENNIEYEARDVSRKEYAQEAMEKSGQAGIPVIDIDGNVIVGFDLPKIKELLKLE